MRIVIIGALGQLGTDLLKQAQRHEVTGLDRPEFDVTYPNGVIAALSELQPDVVINAAAMTNVDGCEDAVDQALAVNASGALHVARATQAIDAKLVYISTDYVFGEDRKRDRPYDEDAAAGPLSVYGASKLAGEHLSMSYCRRTFVVRTSGLYGHAGARGKGGNFVETMLRCAREGRALRVVDDQTVSATSTRTLAGKLLELAATETYGRYHVAASEPCTWFEFAEEIFRYSEVEADLAPIPTSEYKTKAARPLYSALTSNRLHRLGIAPCPGWREMLHQYLDSRPASRPAPTTESIV